MKRMLDVALAGTALFFTAPLLAALGAAIRLETRGPALFRQTRIGRGGQPFRMIKLRTMAVHDDRSGPQVTAAADPRITRVGALLRRTKLDELPQLWNVLRGDMSIVGPRPEVPRYIEKYRPEWRRLLTVRPGLTDLASLAFRDEERLLALADDRERAYTDVVMPMKLELALDSLARTSVLDYFSAIAQTALAVIAPRALAADPLAREAVDRIEALNREGLS